jgi:hypothetical protein
MTKTNSYGFLGGGLTGCGGVFRGAAFTTNFRFEENSFAATESRFGLLYPGGFIRCKI